MGKMTAAQMVAHSLKDVGYDEVGNNKTRFAAVAGHPNGFAWCATWISAKLIEGEVLPKGHSVLSASSRTMFATAKKKGWAVSLENVRPGDVCHMKRGKPNAWQGHVAEVLKVIRRNGKVVEIHTIEGNATAKGHANVGGSVGIHVRTAATWNLGFWRPPYAPATAAQPVAAPAVAAPVVAPVVVTDGRKMTDALSAQVADLARRVAAVESKLPV